MIFRQITMKHFSWELDTVFLVYKLDAGVSYSPDSHTESSCASKSMTQSASGEKTTWSFLKVWQITQKGNNTFQKFSKIEAELKSIVNNTSAIRHPIAVSFTAACGNALALVSSIKSDLGWVEPVSKSPWETTRASPSYCDPWHYYNSYSIASIVFSN